tara:strand:- start:437 stop:700 length:264 start_codon:yes stop_codon:yes gene_type:complete
MSDWLDGTKPKYIECIYETAIEFDLEELGIDYDTIDDYYIKYGKLTVTFKDGTIKSYEGNQIETDYKWAEEESVLDESWTLVEGLNE